MKLTPRRSGPHGSDKRYNSRTWRRYRSTYLNRHPLCVECKRVAQVVDHIIPVRLNDGLDFYDHTNHQSMCHVCHNAKRGRESHVSPTYTRVYNKKG